MHVSFDMFYAQQIFLFALDVVVGGVIFICLQQIVILDCSYNWNDSWYVVMVPTFSLSYTIVWELTHNF